MPDPIDPSMLSESDREKFGINGQPITESHGLGEQTENEELTDERREMDFDDSLFSEQVSKLHKNIYSDPEKPDEERADEIVSDFNLIMSQVPKMPQNASPSEHNHLISVIRDCMEPLLPNEKIMDSYVGNLENSQNQPFIYYTMSYVIMESGNEQQKAECERYFIRYLERQPAEEANDSGTRILKNLCYGRMLSSCSDETISAISSFLEKSDMTLSDQFFSPLVGKGIEDNPASLSRIILLVESVLVKNNISYTGELQELIRAWSKGTKEENRARVISKHLKSFINLEKKSPGISDHLTKQYGITDFGRYPSEILLKQVEEENNLETPYGILINPHSDYNGTFVQQGGVELEGFEDSLQNQYLLRIFECGGKYDIAKTLISLDHKYGQNNKISFVIIGGHGSRESINFGKSWKFSDRLSKEDLGGKGIRRTNSFLSEEPIIILNSCSTGKDEGIAQSLSELYNAKVIAPKSPAGIISMEAKIGDKLDIDVEYYTEKIGTDLSDLKATYIKGRDQSWLYR